MLQALTDWKQYQFVSFEPIILHVIGLCSPLNCLFPEHQYLSRLHAPSSYELEIVFNLFHFTLHCLCYKCLSSLICFSPRSSASHYCILPALTYWNLYQQLVVLLELVSSWGLIHLILHVSNSNELETALKIFHLTLGSPYASSWYFGPFQALTNWKQYPSCFV